jgi:hypothetical protein
MSRTTKINGFSEADQIVADASHRNYRRFTELETFTKQPAYEELWERWQECKEPNWDGYAALPVEQETYNKAWRLLEALPLGFPLPSAGAEPDGNLTLEWYRHPRWTVSVSISPDGTLHYAALLGTEDPRGSCPFFDDIPESLLFLIRRVIRA